MKRITKKQNLLIRGSVLLLLPILLLTGVVPGAALSSSADYDIGPLSEISRDLNAPFLTEAWCADNDGGQVSTVASYVEGIGPNGYPFKKYDACIDGSTLKEFYCKGTVPWPVSISCALGCEDGACLSTCTDNDGDGFAIQGGTCGLVDCDDSDPLINPGMDENCGNGLDDDCNGDVDAADLACLICTDSDSDGYAIEGGVCGDLDCDDAEPGINPGVVEVCDNGIDDDCDGAVDGDDSQCLGMNTLVIGWDGTQRDHFWQCYNAELPECPNGLPHIAELSNGEIYRMVVTSGDSATKPGWAQIFSGYNADQLGIYSNGEYQPIPEGFSVFEKVENHFGSENVLTIFLSGKNVNTGAACIGDETTKIGLPFIEDLGQPWCITKDFLDYYENDLKWNEVVAKRTMQLLELHADDLFVAGVVFREPDVVAHVVGEDSYRYTNSLVDLDYWLGQIMDKVDELGLSQSTLIYVTSDHGIDEGSDRHGNAPFTILASNDPNLVRGGDRMDVGATVLNNYGIDLGASGDIPALSGSPLTSIPAISCVPEGSAFYDYPGAPACCVDLTLINLDYPLGVSCLVATGGTGDTSGWCTDCGDGVCSSPENRCNCPADCQSQ